MKRFKYAVLTVLTVVGLISGSALAQPPEEGNRGTWGEVFCDADAPGAPICEPGMPDNQICDAADLPEAPDFEGAIPDRIAELGGGEKDRGEVLPPPGKGRGIADGMKPFWRNKQTREKLELSEDQVKTLDKGFQETRNKLIDLEADLAHKQIAFDEAMQSETPDLSTVNKTIEELGKARIEIQKATIAQKILVGQTLKSEQKEKLQAFHRQIAGARRGQRPGAGAPGAIGKQRGPFGAGFPGAQGQGPRRGPGTEGAPGMCPMGFGQGPQGPGLGQGPAAGYGVPGAGREARREFRENLRGGEPRRERMMQHRRDISNEEGEEPAAAPPAPAAPESKADKDKTTESK